MCKGQVMVVQLNVLQLNTQTCKPLSDVTDPVQPALIGLITSQFSNCPKKPNDFFIIVLVSRLVPSATPTCAWLCVFVFVYGHTLEDCER